MRPDQITAFVQAVAADLRDMLGEGFDEATFLDTLDGETDALDVADRLIEEMMQAEALASAAMVRSVQLRDRANRLDARSDAFKARLGDLMDAMGLRKLERPQATLSRRSGSLSVHITDEASIPTQLCKVVRSPDKAAIRKSIEAGEPVPGAELVRGPDSLTVRVA